MNQDMLNARSILSQGAYTCVLCKGETVYCDSRRGVRPLLELMNQGIDLRGFSAADKVVGKAAAFLYQLMGVHGVYAQVISVPAKEVLDRSGLSVCCEKAVPAIQNRDKTGLCPLESAVWDITDAATAKAVIEETLANL